jgi:hypothetical protein
MVEFPEVDITEWRAAGPEQLGTKPKRWLEDPTGALWLFKGVTTNPRSGGERYEKGDDWSERVAGFVAVDLGLPCAEVELAVSHHPDGDERGIISRKVLDDEHELIHGNELLAEIGILGESTRDRRGYTLAAVQQVLSPVDPPVTGAGLSAWEWFVGYLVLDAIIGNTDRHQENWAVIGDGTRRLAPTFDHASSLGFLLDDDQRQDRLRTSDQNRTVTRWASRAESKFEGKPHPCQVAADALGMCNEQARRRWVEAVNGIETIDGTVARLPAGRASIAAREFAAALFTANRSQLLSYPVCTLNP